MNIVNLITSINDQLRQPIHNRGFVINEFSPSAGDSDLEEKIFKGKNNYTLLEISAADDSLVENLTERVKMLYEKSKLICITRALTPPLRKFLLKAGISDCVTDFSPERIASYLENLNKKPAPRTGTFIIYDDDQHRINMLNSIIKRFGYNTLTVSSVDELFLMTGEPDIMMVLINIGTEGIDLNGLVRKSFINTEIRKNPVIAYKCMEKGLFVHEIINGLNRLTKAILSPEELYCMLTDMLFKKELISHTHTYISTLKYEKYSPYSMKTVQQIYYEYNGSPCRQESLFEKERIDSMIDSAEMIRNTLIRADGIIWLKHQDSESGRPTCGAAGV